MMQIAAVVGVAMLGTVVLGALASVLAVPIGIGVALWVRWLCPPLLRRSARVVLGAVGEVPPACLAIGLVLLPVDGWAWSVGLTVVGMAMVAVPTIASRAFQALDKVPSDEVLQTISLGATPSQAVASAVLPSAWNGLVRSGVLGASRAVGETVVVLLLLDGLAGQTTTLSRALVLGTLAAPSEALSIATLLAVTLGVVGTGLWMLGHRRGSEA